ncbi:MAG: hypothetical protein WC302_01395 [Candidatus Paceibacterota bacterium]|jgi:hypothetical protein
MKKIVLISVILIIVLAILAGFYIFNKNKLSVVPPEDIPQNDEPSEASDQNELLADNQTEMDDAAKERNKLVTDDFSMDLPVGWSKTQNTMAEVTAMAANMNEDIGDAAAQAINFKSYLAVSSDLLQGKTMDEYMSSVKSELQTAVPGIIFTNENSLTINGKPTRAIEAEMTQQGVNFKVLIVVVQSDDAEVWVMSYNTVKSSWDEYKEDFSESARSFVIKK